MITVDVPRHGTVALDEDDERMVYEPAERLSASRVAGGTAPAENRARALVEVQLRHGGMAPRAVVGGEFVVHDGTETLFEVLVDVDYDTLVPRDGKPDSTRTVPGRIYPDWTFIAGLPKDYAAAALSGLVDSPSARHLPPGTLRLDRAAFDEVESSSPIFARASTALCCVLSAKLYGRDPEADLRALMEIW